MKDFFKLNVVSVVNFLMILGCGLMSVGSVKASFEAAQIENVQTRLDLKSVLININDLRERIARIEGAMNISGRKGIVATSLTSE